MDQIYRHRRNRHALPLSIQGFRDWKETREWKKLMERVKAEKRRFEYRERTLFGFLSNAISLLRPGMQRNGRGLLPVLFNLLVSGNARRELLLVKQGLAQKALSEKHFGKRKARAVRIRLIRDAQFEALSHAYDIQKQALDLRHEREAAVQKQEWQALSIERKRLWAAMGGGIRAEAPAAAEPGIGQRRQPPAIPCPAPPQAAVCQTRLNRPKSRPPSLPICGPETISRQQRSPMARRKNPAGKSAAPRPNGKPTEATNRGSAKVRHSRCIICALSH